MTDPLRFDPGSHRTFRIVGRAYDVEARTITLRYALDDRTEFTETITFETPPGPGADPGGPTGVGFERALLHLHVAAGTSYYKTAAPAQVVVEGESLSAPELELYHRLYDEGLHEFAVTNGLAVPRPVAVVAGRGEAGHPLPPRACSGRASWCRSAGERTRWPLIESVRTSAPVSSPSIRSPLVLELADEAGLDVVVVRRRLDPGWPHCNTAGALNGHVPITAIVSLVAVVGAFVHGYDTVAMAMERSASEETVTVGGVAVNHQYSKSREFELLLADLVRRTVAPS